MSIASKRVPSATAVLTASQGSVPVAVGGTARVAVEGTLTGMFTTSREYVGSGIEAVASSESILAGLIDKQLVKLIVAINRKVIRVMYLLLVRINLHC